MDGIWEALKEQIKLKMPEKSFALWINPITLLETKNETLTLGCPNKFSRNWIMEHYMSILGSGLENIGFSHYRVDLKVGPIQRTLLNQDLILDSRQLVFPPMARNGNSSGPWLNKEFTFDRFVVGKSNEFAYTVSRSIASGDNCPSHPFFLLANTGLGKSHLSQAIAHAILAQDSSVRVCYVTAEDFMNQMVFAIKNNRTDEFKNKYRKGCDVLLLEEVHFLSGKPKTQLELGHTLDALSNDRKKIIFTSSLLPKNIPNMTRELSSRLTSGIITAIEKPDFDTRVKILEKKAQDLHLNLSDEIILFLAKHLNRDVRQLESALRCLKAKSDLLKIKITADLVKEGIKCHTAGEGAANTVDDIKRLVCQYFKIEPEILASKSRKRIHAYPRNVFAYLCRHHSDETLENIGKAINRNHSTVVYAAEVIEKNIKLDQKTRNQINFLVQKLQVSPQ